MLIVMAFVAIFAPFIAPYNYDEMQVGGDLEPPSSRHIMGTDKFGRDILSRVVYGTRISFGISLLVMVISLFLGAPLGLLAGYYGGKTDALINGFANTMLSFPCVLMALTVTAIIGPGVEVVIISLGLTNSAPLIRLVRGLTLTLREREFVKAAISVGESR
ncbi:MAG: ABC transporter permease, partial [Clostridiales bacterium]|nr:ABC transporter permease [Clostridiales bacterium]